MIFYDTETCGLHGMCVLIQWAEDDGPINLHNVWQEPVGKTLELIQWMMSQTVVGFNLTFDHFQLCKLYTIFSQLDPEIIPEENIELIAMMEPHGRMGPCLKPAGAIDLMLHARKGPYQSLMERKDIRIRKVPTAIAQPLADELSKRIEIDGIYFARRKDRFAPNWKVYDRKKKGGFDPDFKDVMLKFQPSGGLKTLAQHALGVEEVVTFDEVGIDKAFYPDECGWAPYALALSTPEKKWTIYHKQGKKDTYAWPAVIQHHIDHWAYNPLAKQYATDDVHYTRKLYHHFQPEPSDDDSILACMVGAVRWRGYAVNLPAIKALKTDAIKKSRLAPKDPASVKRWILPDLDEVEQLAMQDYQGEISTKRVILETIASWEGHPAAIKAQAVLDARKAKKETEIYDKIIQAGRFHASFVVIGTLSNRMSGSDGLNPQGINHKKEVRQCFTLADPDFQLDGGDFDAFEVVLADAVYDDPNLRAEITKIIECPICEAKNPACKECNGKGKITQKIHAMYAMELFPGKTYKEILESKGCDPDLYDKGKKGVFQAIYGGDENTLVNKLGIPLEVALAALASWMKRFFGVKKSRQRIFDAFCSMRQPAGIGSKVFWHDPADFVESFLGFRRYFTLENKICKALFDLASKVPDDWKDLKIKVTRREGREQTAAGATMSALIAAAFGIQGANMRAAANHEIQSPGAKITKTVQCAIWKVQPVGISDWRVVPMNVHDELMAPTKPEYSEQVKANVLECVESFRPKVPLIKMVWQQKLKNWAGK